MNTYENALGTWQIGDDGIHYLIEPSQSWLKAVKEGKPAPKAIDLFAILWKKRLITQEDLDAQ